MQADRLDQRHGYSRLLTSATSDGGGFIISGFPSGVEARVRLTAPSSVTRNQVMLLISTDFVSIFNTFHSAEGQVKTDYL